MCRQGTISKERVKKNGEVFTPDEIVNDMLDLTDNYLADKLGVNTIEDIDDIIYIKDTRLEPACGDGAILVRVLDRKLGRVEKIKNSGGNWKEALLYSVASIYGIDITPDNVVMTKRRLLEVILIGSIEVLSLAEETPIKWKSHGFELDEELLKLVKLILDFNIQCGNTLTGEQYKIYCTGFDCWNCNIDLIDERHIYRNKLDTEGNEIEGWETQSTSLKLTQWKFNNTQYINRYCTYNDYQQFMEDGQSFIYYNNPKLELYCKHRDPSEDKLDNYDF